MRLQLQLYLLTAASMLACCAELILRRWIMLLQVAVLYASDYGYSDRLSQTIARGITKANVAVEMLDLLSADPQVCALNGQPCDSNPKHHHDPECNSTSAQHLHGLIPDSFRR